MSGMSKIDGGDIQRSVALDIERSKGHVRSDAQSFIRVSEEQAKKLLEKMVDEAKLQGSMLLRIDLNSVSSQVRQILADNFLKVVQQVPGFVQPQLSTPPLPEEVKALLKQLLAFEQNGMLAKSNAFEKAGRPDDARGGLMQSGMEDAPSLKSWGHFVHSPTNAQGTREALAPTREGLVEGQAPHELHTKEKQNSEATLGAGLRSPTVTTDGFAALSNKKKLDIMSMAFGKEMALALKGMDIRSPAQLLKAAATPEGREMLAKQLGMSRAQLTVHLSRAEMLSIGAGRSGEISLRPQHLPALQNARIVTQSQLASVHSMPETAFNQVYQSVREGGSAFARAMSGERPVLKKDLQHWSKTAARRKSSLLDADWEEMPKKSGDAEEMIMGWYLEHWAELEDQQKQRERVREEKAKAEKEELKLHTPKSEIDPARDDGLICFWIERPNLNFDRPTFTERVYVCLDPRTGMIDLKSKE
jgi:DNA-binding transcriptional ArsR family regulator